MFSAPRPYQGERDLDRMRSLLRVGRRARSGTYYIHTGDINWWLFYPPLGVDLFEHLYVWDDPSNPERILGWTLLSPDSFCTYDVVVQPELRGSPLAQAMMNWAEQKLTGILRASGKDTIRMMWILEDDALMDTTLRQRGFQPDAADVHMLAMLDEPIHAYHLQDGWGVRSCRGLDEVEARATAQHGAFGSSAPMDAYVARFRRFMRSGVYNPEWDTVAVRQDGTIGAFCITWPDPLNRVVLFEPVGTHPDFQRQGLGRAVMLESLRRFRESGMRQAIVTTNEDNEPAIKLYESVGFRMINRLLIYKKSVQLKESGNGRARL